MNRRAALANLSTLGFVATLAGLGEAQAAQDIESIICGHSLRCDGQRVYADRLADTEAVLDDFRNQLVTLARGLFGISR